MMDARNTCIGAEDQCHRCETVPLPNTGDGEKLLLAPLDGDAGDALLRILRASGLSYERCGPVIALEQAGRGTGRVHDRLKEMLPPLLQKRIKGVFAPSTVTLDGLLDALIQAETLTELFDQVEVEWARTILTADRLFCVYHPIIDARDGSVFAYEALIRARHPHNEEIIGAGQLIYACERLGLEHHLDQRARVTAIRDAAALGLDGTHLFVNFRPGSIYDPEICLRSTMAAAAECGIPLNRLVFEVIETEQIPSMDRLRKVAEYYRSQGAGIALDDISSGFASLQYLADLLPDYAKIDRLLVESAASSVSARHTLDSIVGLAKKLDVRVIAEGIETQEQMQICVDAGVDYLQGFLFAYPAAPPERVWLLPFDAMRMAA